MPQSISSQASATGSETSTVIYEQEPFETFKDRVRALCTTLWPSILPEAIQIDRMHGGSSNRVVGITVSSPSGEHLDNLVTKKYVLRVPRFEGERIEPELATLCFVQEKAPAIPVPEVIAFDLTCENPLSKVYNIQLRLAGVRLVDVYMGISQVERLSIIHQLAQVIHNMHKVRSPLPGILDAGKLIAGTEKKQLVQEIKVMDFITKTVDDPTGGRDSSAKQKPIFQLLIDQFDGWQAYGQKYNRGASEVEHMDYFRTIARQMKQLGLLKGSDYVLSHPDFDTQNILVSKQSDSEWKVSGVLDWDGAILAPYAVACRPPTWIWSNWNDNGEEDEAVLYKLPDDPEQRERKELFDTLMGEPYTEYAYSTPNRLVRKLFEFAMNGVNSSHEEKDMKAFFEEWREFHKEVGGGAIRRIYDRASGILTKLQDNCRHIIK